MNKLLIIDGHNLLFQMFFGMPSRIINKQGKAIHGTLGFIGALRKILKITAATHIVVIFDGDHENRRTETDPDYKANRVDYSEIPDEINPFSQLEDIYTALNFMKINHFETSDFEADDVIACYAHTYGKNTKIVISSFDSDFFQLINDNISVLRYRGTKTIICDVSFVKEKYGILPAQYADFKSLTGDKADNIKGARKVGIKTAATLLNQFGSLQNIISRANEISKPHIRESILQSSQRLQNNYKLIKLENNLVPELDLNSLLYKNSDFVTTEVLIGIKLYP